MAYTLADYSRMAQDPLVKGVVDVFRKESHVLDSLRIETTGYLKYDGMRTSTLPSVYWRKIGESYTESKGVTEPVSERIALLGSYIDVPKELADAKGQIVNQRAYQTQMFLTAMAREFDNKYFNGNSNNDVDELVGLTFRVSNDMAASQSISAASLDVSPNTSTTGWAVTFLNYVHQLMHACDGHTCDDLYMNDSTYIALMAALRSSGQVDTTTDNFGRKWATFGPGGPKIVDIGYCADQTTKIITDTETSAGATTGGALTSIYAVKYGEGYVQGWDLAPLKATDIGLLESGVSYRTIVDWGVGLHYENPRSFARLYAITAA
jgi:hypothetical protein